MHDLLTIFSTHYTMYRACVKLLRAFQINNRFAHEYTCEQNFCELSLTTNGTIINSSCYGLFLLINY